jgi:hypothetical protein
MGLDRNNRFAHVKASQRRVRLTQNQPKPLQPGDTVHWNDRYRGTVIEVFTDATATVIEDQILGRQVTWRLDIKALRRDLPT